jgi:hypothetical protein
VFVFDLEIQVNNTEPTKDDIVQVMSEHPPHVFIVPCQIRVKDPRPTAPVRIDLLDPNHRLKFSLPTDTTVGNLLTVDVPTDGNWVPFEIAGAVASETKGDAQIEAFYRSEAVAVKNVTVFTFEKAKISVKKGGTYVLVGDTYGPDNGVAVSFSATARLKPARLDCTAPQIANLRVGIVAEMSNGLFRRTTTYDRPRVKWVPDPSLPPAPHGTKVTVKNQVREEILYDSGPLSMSISRVGGAAPLWDIGDALKPPTGCTGAGAATSFAAPIRPGLRPTSEPMVLRSDDNPQVTKAAEVTWTRLVSTTLEMSFRTYCVVADTTGTEKKFCALRRTEWELNVDSKGPRAKQRAIVHGDDVPTFDPAPPPDTDPKFFTRHIQVDAATTTTFTKP